ncbi:hypothetical protein FRB94_011952 [Tulasnella sp. JGI-2019a]|nr:hypothetical protein FRB94_011952 [Tulasnella sp. JGI-2019a]
MSNPNSSSSTPKKGESSASTPTTTGAPVLPGQSAPPAKSQSASKPKPVNVFSNDGSFLERFQRTKKEEDEKKKQEEATARKRAFDDRFKNRGKRKAVSPSAEEPSDSTPPVKKAKELTQYEKEVKSYEGRSLKDQGIGIRPLVK